MGTDTDENLENDAQVQRNTNVVQSGAARVHVIEPRPEGVQAKASEIEAICEGCGREFVRTRNIQRFCSKACSQRARDRKRWSKRRNARLQGAEVERYRSDGHLEQVQGNDFIICRICGGPYQTLYSHIRDVHGMTGQQYRSHWPGAPLATEAINADHRERSRKRRRASEDPKAREERQAKAREYQRQYRATHDDELRKKRREKRAANFDVIKERKRQWRAAHREKVNRRQRELYAADRDNRNARQRAARAADPKRFQEYGRKNYLKHQKTRVEYAASRRKATWRPMDWDLKPIEWRIIGTELLTSAGYMSNRELGKRLDTSRVLRCPYGPSWQRVLSSDKREKHRRAFNFISDIRKWVKRPGKTPGSK